MDRRGFLKGLGIGGALVVAAPQLVLAATTKVALPERRVFVPPAGGWLTWGEGESALGYVRRIPGSDNVYVDSYSAVGGGYLVPQEWSAEIVRFLRADAFLDDVGSERSGAGWSGWLMDRTIDCRSEDAAVVRDRWTGRWGATERRPRSMAH